MRGLADHVLPLSVLFRSLGRAGLLNVSQLDFYREGQVWGSLVRTDKRAGANSKRKKNGHEEF